MDKLIRIVIALLIAIGLLYSLVFNFKIDIESKSKKDDIIIFKGPGPIHTWVSLSRKREQDGCSTSGQYNDSCVNMDSDD